eukprot:5192958-Amphidinium_carterae.1
MFSGVIHVSVDELEVARTTERQGVAEKAWAEQSMSHTKAQTRMNPIDSEGTQVVTEKVATGGATQGKQASTSTLHTWNPTRTIQQPSFHVKHMNKDDTQQAKRKHSKEVVNGTERKIAHGSVGWTVATIGRPVVKAIQ